MSVRIWVRVFWNDVKVDLGVHRATAATSRTVCHLIARVHTILGQQKSLLLGMFGFCEPNQVVIWHLMSCVVE